LNARITAEWNPLRTAVICRPGMEMFFCQLAPYDSLYEHASSQVNAIREHERLEHILSHEFHVKVIRLRNTIMEAAEKSQDIHDRLMDLAHEVMVENDEDSSVTAAGEKLEKNENFLDSGQFLDVLLLNPQIDWQYGQERGTIHLNMMEKELLCEIHLMRDQQAVTDKGIFLSRMGKPQRKREPNITKLLWEALGLDIVHTVNKPGTFEGGDFIPLKDFALVGIGNRTNASGVQQLLDKGVTFDEIGVVHQPKHPLIPSESPDSVVSIHLDTYINIASSGVAIGLEPLLREAKVDVYHQDDPGVYEKEKNSIDLYTYITGWGFDVVNITTLEQLSHASNFLTIRDGTILAVEVEREIKEVLFNLENKAKTEPDRYGALLNQAIKDYEHLREESEFFPYKRELSRHGIDAYPIDLKNLTGGYSAVHSMTAALERG
jgi:arginine deiminase